MRYKYGKLGTIRGFKCTITGHAERGMAGKAIITLVRGPRAYNSLRDMKKHRLTYVNKEKLPGGSYGNS